MGHSALPGRCPAWQAQAGWARAATGRKEGRRRRRRRRRRRGERKEEEKKNEKRAAKCEGEASEGIERRKDGNVYSVAVAIAAGRIFNPVVIATWAAMTRKTK